jgi:hypothetical protein
MTSVYALPAGRENSVPAGKVNAKLGINELFSSVSLQLPYKSHCSECQVKENHFGIAVALDVCICKVKLTVKGIDVPVVYERMEPLREFILGPGEIYQPVFPAVEVENEVFTYHPE